MEWENDICLLKTEDDVFGIENIGNEIVFKNQLGWVDTFAKIFQIFFPKYMTKIYNNL